MAGPLVDEPDGDEGVGAELVGRRRLGRLVGMVEHGDGGAGVDQAPADGVGQRGQPTGLADRERAGRAADGALRAGRAPLGPRRPSSRRASRLARRRSAATVSAPQMPSLVRPALRWNSVERLDRAAARRCRRPDRRRSPGRRAGAAARRRRRRGASVPAGTGTGRRAGDPASTSDDQVWRPQMPSTRRPRRSWNSRTARSVPGPYSPAGSPPDVEPERGEAALDVAHGLPGAAGMDGQVGHGGRQAGGETTPARMAVRAGATLGDARRRAWRAAGLSRAQMNSLSSSSNWPLPLAPTRRLAGCAVLEDDQRRDAHDAEALGRLRVLVDVELGDRRPCRPAQWRSRRGWGRSSCTVRTTRPRSRRSRRARRR